MNFFNADFTLKIYVTAINQRKISFLSNFQISPNFPGIYITFALSINEMRSILLKISLK